MSETAPPVDLRLDHWAIVRSVLRQHVPDREVLAFGSRATWTAKNYSDLDLTILGDEPLPLDVSSALAEALSDSDLPFKVDRVDWARIGDTFRNIIRRNGLQPHGSKHHRRMLLQRKPSQPVRWRHRFAGVTEALFFLILEGVSFSYLRRLVQPAFISGSRLSLNTFLACQFKNASAGRSSVCFADTERGLP